MNNILDKIENKLHCKGWVNKNPTRIGSDKLCLGYATAYVTFDENISYYKVHTLLLKAIEIQTGKQWRSVPHYNDAPERTFEDILNVLQIARQIEQVEKLKEVEKELV